MKRYLLIALMAAFAISFSLPGKAQGLSTNTVTKTITAADTITHLAVGSKVRGFQYTFTKSSGTAAGKVYFQGTINGTWVNIDSLTLADNTTAQTKVITVAPTAGTVYKSYRWVNTNTSSATASVTAVYIRRSDESPAPEPAPQPTAFTPGNKYLKSLYIPSIYYMPRKLSRWDYQYRWVSRS